MTANGINYRDTFFEFPDLTKIHGEPDSESLYKIRNELRANAKSVYSNLSDGAHGHLALVMAATQYALVSNMDMAKSRHKCLKTVNKSFEICPTIQGYPLM